jgi:nicotinamidase-related amidase
MVTVETREIDLDSKTSALVLIDLQYGIVARQLAPHASADVLQKSARLADAVRAKGGTVVFVRVQITEVLRLPSDESFPAGTGALPANASELVPEAGVQAGDVVVTKRQWGAFYGTDLEQQLRRRGIRTIILGGIATNFGVESTARAAFDQGYELVFAEDAMSSLSAEAHTFSVSQIFPRMGRVRSTEGILKGLG